MKDKLEVGMYVRIDGRKATTTKYQKFFMIDKIHYIDNCKSKYKYFIKEDQDGYCYAVSDEMIVKASHNIIELIRAGDYVNGKLVVGYGIDNLDRENIKCGYYDDEYGEVSIRDKFYEEDIKSIVTKEQFKAMEYKIEEEI